MLCSYPNHQHLSRCIGNELSQQQRDLLNPIKELGALIVEALGTRQTWIVVVGILRDPHGHVGVCAIDLTHVAGQAFEISIPMHRDEVGAAVAGARREEVLQPSKPTGSTSHSGRSKLYPHLLQRLHFTHPGLRSQLRVNVTTAVVCAIGLVEGEDVRDVRAAFD